jgi:redox-sensitive bicupin YhaK (pirin superfamily)
VLRIGVMSTVRTIEQRRALELQRMTPSFTSYGLRSTPSFSLDPFLNLDDFVMSEPTFPPHPHAGFSAVTYMFEDSAGAFLNRDSLGDRSRIEPGAIHWTQAARGMMHEEVPERRGEACHGLQMFVNLRDEHKRAAPAAYHAARAEVPEVRPTPGARVRVLAGAFGGVVSPLTKLLTPVTFLEIHLAPGALIQVDAPRAHNAFVMIVRGGGSVAGAAAKAHEALLFAHDGDFVRLEGGADGMQLLFGEGAPIGEPVAFGGPFVMTRPGDIVDARERFARGEMGSLAPSFRRGGE